MPMQPRFICQRLFAVMAVMLLLPQEPALSQGKVAAIKEIAKRFLQKFSGDASGETVEGLASKIDDVVVRYGDDAATAVDRVGPRAFRLMSEAGENGTAATKLMARHGDDAIWIVAKPKRLAIFAKYGDDASEAMIRHRQIAETLIGQFGDDAAAALSKVIAQNGRRIAMMNDEKLFTGLSRSDELLAVIGKYGDSAADFIWQNKAALAVGTGLVAFLANPDPFIQGTTNLADIAAENTIGPIATGIGASTNWTLLGAIAIVFIGGAVLLRKRTTSIAETSPSNHRTKNE